MITFYFRSALSAAGAAFNSHGRKAVDSFETKFEARRAGTDAWESFD